MISITDVLTVLRKIVDVSLVWFIFYYMCKGFIDYNKINDEFINILYYLILFYNQ